MRTAPLRRIEVVLPEGDRLRLPDQHLDLGATTVARIYKERWQIELFFKALKQNLRVKTFVGTTANALHIQIWTALIALLLLQIPAAEARFGWSLSNLVALLRMNLFVYRDLWPGSTIPSPVRRRSPSLSRGLGMGIIRTASREVSCAVKALRRQHCRKISARAHS